MGKIKVLVVDDSALMRKLISDMLTADPDLEVVGTALNGRFALEKIPKLNPDIITLDVEMPEMDGLATLREMKQRNHRIPVIMLSSFTTAGAEMTLQALEQGAIDFISKPSGTISTDIDSVQQELITKIKTIGALHRAGTLPPESAAAATPPAGRPATVHPGHDLIVAIGISTGGPNALSEMLPRFPADFPAGIVIVQHMPEGFTRAFAERLNNLSKIEVKEAADGDLVKPGRAIVARGDHHLMVQKLKFGTIVKLTKEEPVSGHRPSADVLFRSVALEYGPAAVGVIMTGMGNDGAAGLGEMYRHGAGTIAQDRESCVVYGMPRVAVENQVVGKVVPLVHMAETIMQAIAARLKQ